MSQELTHLYKVLIKRKRCDLHSDPCSSLLLDERAPLTQSSFQLPCTPFPKALVRTRGRTTQIKVFHTWVSGSQTLWGEQLIFCS